MTNPEIQEATLTANGQFSPWFSFTGMGSRFFATEAYGTFVGTLTVQLRFEGKPSIDLEAFTAPFSRIGQNVGAFEVRVGFTAFTSGSADVVIRR